MFESLYQRVLGHPFVFNRIRPMFVGGIDWTTLYQEALAAGPESVVLDVGCGTGIAHQYLKGFREYHGFDTDSIAIAAAQSRTAGPHIHYQNRLLTKDDILRIQPTHVLLSGLLHHLSDEDSLALLRMCAETASVRRIASADTVYIRGQHINNILAYFDRGRFVRRAEEFVALAQRANLQVLRHALVRSHPTKGRAIYLIMTLAPKFGAS